LDFLFIKTSRASRTSKTSRSSRTGETGKPSRTGKTGKTSKTGKASDLVKHSQKNEIEDFCFIESKTSGFSVVAYFSNNFLD
jgi:hypothetical protein